MNKSDFLAALANGQIGSGEPIVVINVGEIIGVIGMLILASVGLFMLWKADK